MFAALPAESLSIHPSIYLSERQRRHILRLAETLFMAFCEKGTTSEVIGDALSCRCEKIIVWLFLSPYGRIAPGRRRLDQKLPADGAGGFMSFYTELVHRELDILKQELRRLCAVDMPHISIKRFAISQPVGQDIVPYAAHSPGTQIRYINVTHTPRTPQA